MKSLLTILIMFTFSTVSLAEEGGCAFASPDSNIAKESLKKITQHKTSSSGTENENNRKMTETFIYKKDHITILQRVGCEDSMSDTVTVETKKLNKLKNMKPKKLMSSTIALLDEIKILTHKKDFNGLSAVRELVLKKEPGHKKGTQVFTAKAGDEYSKSKIKITFQKKSASIQLDSSFYMGGM